MTRFILASGRQGVTAVENSFIEGQMLSAPGEAVKVYLYGLMRASTGAGTGASGNAQADDDADSPFDEAALISAYNYWQSVGLVRIISSSPLAVEYLRGDSASLPSAPRKYASLIAKLNTVAGTRAFTGFELGEIYDYIEVYGFTEDTAVALVADVLRRHGANSKMYRVNSEAKLWADNGVVTLEDAREYIEKRDARSSGAQKLLSRWKRSRTATEDEVALYSKWTDMWGFEESVILDACQELTGAETPSFKYLDTVLATYRLNGALTSETLSEFRKRRDASLELARLMFERAGIKRAPTRRETDDVDSWLNTLHMSAELLLFAADASLALPQPYANIKKLVSSFQQEGISTVAAARASVERSDADKSRRAGAKKARRALTSERKYSDEELKSIGVSLLDSDDFDL